MHQPPRIIAHLLSLSRQWNWSKAKLASEIGISRAALVLIQYGHRKLSMQVFSNITEKFSDDRMVRELLHHYAAVEHKRKPAAALPVVPPELDERAARALATYAERLKEETVHGGRGLYLASRDARSLSAASQYLMDLFRAARVDVCLLRADRKPTATDATFALAAPLLIAERIDFATDTVTDLLRRRADLIRPMVVTSMTQREGVADDHLRRVLLSMTRPVDLGSSPFESTLQPLSPEQHVDAA